MKKGLFLILVVLFTTSVHSGPHYVNGQITSILAHGTNPAIRIGDNAVPDKCNGGTYGWMYFSGSPEERSRIFAAALALSLSGKNVTVYTNDDGLACKISQIQVTRGLNG